MKTINKIDKSFYLRPRETPIRAPVAPKIQHKKHGWRKYGEKRNRENLKVTSYYRCVTPGCQVHVYVDKITDHKTRTTQIVIRKKGAPLPECTNSHVLPNKDFTEDGENVEIHRVEAPTAVTPVGRELLRTGGPLLVLSDASLSHNPILHVANKPKDYALHIPPDAVGKNLWDILVPYDDDGQEIVAQMYKDAVATNVAKTCLVRCRSPDSKTILNIIVTVSAIRTDKKLYSFNHSIADVTSIR